MDIKGMYQNKAEEIADTRFDKDFYDLSEEQQSQIYGEAITQVNEELVCSADNLREELYLRSYEQEDLSSQT